jgi:hypothetical protein
MPDPPAHRSAETPESPRSYEEFLEDIKARIRSAQARAARAINAELIECTGRSAKRFCDAKVRRGIAADVAGPRSSSGCLWTCGRLSRCARVFCEQPPLHACLRCSMA